jgi:hypothetical protein
LTIRQIMGNSPSAPSRSRSSNSKRRSSFPFSLTSKKPRAQLDEQSNEGATDEAEEQSAAASGESRDALQVVTPPLSKLNHSLSADLNFPDVSYVLSEEDEVENILDSPLDHHPNIPQMPPMDHGTAPGNKEDVGGKQRRKDSTIQPEHNDKANVGVREFWVHQAG